MVSERYGNRSPHLVAQCRKDGEHAPGLLSWNHHRCAGSRLLVEVHWTVEMVIFEVEAGSTGSDTELFSLTDHLMSLI